MIWLGRSDNAVALAILLQTVQITLSSRTTAKYHLPLMAPADNVVSRFRGWLNLQNELRFFSS